MTLTRRSRSSKTTRLALSGLSLATLAHSFVVPKSSNGEALVGQSSTRKSLNFGPNVHSNHHSIINPSPALTLYNSQADLLSQGVRSSCASAAAQSSLNQLDAASCRGNGIAREFLNVLHPDSNFRLVNGYTSAHNGIYHAYFVQLINDVPVANGNLNLNVDLATNQVISYGDSSFTHEQSIGAQIEQWKKTVASWAEQAIEDAADQLGQVVFGAPGAVASADDALSDASVGQRLARHASPPFNPAGTDSGVQTALFEKDPRHGLLSFLALQSPERGLTTFLDRKSRDELLDLLALEPVREGPVTFETVHKISNVPTAVAPVKASLSYIHDGQSTLKLAWKYELQTNDNHYEAYVDATPGAKEETLMVVDWVRDYRPTGGEMGFEALSQPFGTVVNSPRKGRLGRKPSSWRSGAEVHLASEGTVDAKDFGDIKPAYKVFPWGVNAPDEGKRQLLQGTLVELDEEASPVGWHTIPATFKGGKDKQFYDTRGNNVYAQDNPDGGNGYENNYRPSGGANLTFDFPLGWPKEGTPLDPRTYINASVTELFYTNNEIHDLFYRYGFDEVSGNFQDYNFGRGGLGDDAVQANAQDGSGMNNANFATPPDGSRPRMRMYSWSGSQPYRDGDFEAGIVIHEYSHGISTRLTGGPANSGCLGWGEAGGMGEGWGDFFATMIRMHSINETEFSMGEWASSRKNGIRNYKYSRNMTVNPSTYKTLDKPGYWGVHAIGEVWAEILFEAAELLIDEHGFQSSLFPPPVNSTDSSNFYDEKYTKTKVPKAGNTLIVQLVVDAMKLQPCRPSFQNARDAILQADKVLTGGANECTLWKGFSRRGLGPDAEVVGSTPWGGGVRTDDYKLPPKCAKKSKN
ncbi:hypothetical protein T439DRAFT_329204 [Meredithblackwellia eburnea MCA 4105]